MTTNAINSRRFAREAAPRARPVLGAQFPGPLTVYGSVLFKIGFDGPSMRPFCTRRVLIVNIYVVLLVVNLRLVRSWRSAGAGLTPAIRRELGVDAGIYSEVLRRRRTFTSGRPYYSSQLFTRRKSECGAVVPLIEIDDRRPRARPSRGSLGLRDYARRADRRGFAYIQIMFLMDVSYANRYPVTTPRPSRAARPIPDRYAHARGPAATVIF
ncbi:hypothetical protein EVAR_4806_1 [Eumeta japonica]|uniref:Uncharacterized protein n=1 Tax=Eumeta variegata TaxID=151549 RepID=A0A4C1SZU0_EUMVA|nr:hypothetical protein EVAR_4806_1 [Eumeta japonica]